MTEHNLRKPKAEQKKGLRRNTTTSRGVKSLEKYYTNPIVVQLCLDYVQKTLQIDPLSDLIIEPSAGNGSFIPGIKKLTNNFEFYDLFPEGKDNEIIEQDYLLYSPLQNRQTLNGKIHIIGNPPFGRQSSLAIKFIKKSCEFCDTISFILPRSFKKDSLKRAFPLNYHLLFESDLPNNSFTVNGEKYDVPCIFQIWEKRDDTECRVLKQQLEPINFLFVKKTENPDISFRRVGVNAGTIIYKHDVRFDTCSIQSHYFIKFTNGKSITDNILALSEIKYTQSDYTVGPKSISKQELIQKFNPLL